MSRWQLTWLVLVCACCALGTADSLRAAEPIEMAADTTGVITAPAPLKRWTLAITAAGVNRDDVSVFDRAGLPEGTVEKKGSGGGLSFGYRFGDRFLLALQGVVSSHQTDSLDTELYDVEFLVTGTVFFWSHTFFQPFLRGGFGGSGMILRDPAADVFIFGPGAIGGGGFQLRLGRWVSLEFEFVGTFANYLKATRDPLDSDDSDTWNVRTSSMGTRSGLAIYFWF